MFMKPALYKGAYYEVETTAGTEVVPEDVVGEAVRDLPLFCEGDVLSYEKIESGILCRLSAPGFMDCTPWSACKTVEEARELLLSLLEGEDDSESAVDSALRRL